MKRKIKFTTNRILAYLLIAAQLFSQISLPVIAEDSVSEEIVVEEIQEEIQEEVQEDIVVEESPIVEEPLVEDTPMVEETPMVEKTPVVEETPVIEETPVVEEIPVSEESNEQQGNQEEVIEEENQSNEEAILYAVKVIDSVSSEVLVESELEEGSEYDLASVSVPEHEGYVFDGFYVNDTKVEGIYTVPASATEIIVKYSVSEAETEVITYAVKVVSSIDNAVIFESDFEENAEFDLTTVTVPEVEGYTFEGFYVTEEKVESAYVVVEDTEISAVYIEIEEEVVYPEFSAKKGSVGILAAEGVLPEGTIIKAEEKEDTVSEYELLLEELNNDLELVDENTFAEVTNLKVYDITLESEGVSVQPNGNVEVTIDFEIKEDKTYFAYYINGTTPERLESEVTSNGVKFNTNHFSTYAVAEVELMATLAEGETTTFADTCTYAGNEDLFTQVNSNSTGTYYFLDDEGVLWLYGDNSTLYNSSAYSSPFLSITSSVISVKFTDDCGTINVTDARGLFYNFTKCTSIDLSKFDTSSCTNMYNMFSSCKSLTTIDISGFNTSNVTNMQSMFYNCSALTTLDVSGFNTSNVTNMQSMFYNCSALTTLDVSDFNTSNVTNMSSMFYNCSSLTTIDISGFNTSNVTKMSSMFSGCETLTSIDVSNFSTGNVITMSSMFSGCSALTSIDITNFDTSKVTSMQSMFYNCSSLTTLDVSGFNTSQVTSMQSMFYNCSSLTTLDISDFNTSQVTNMSYMFCDCTTIATIDISSWDMSNVTNVSNMFNCGYGALIELKLPNITATTRSMFIPSVNNVWCYNQDYTKSVHTLLNGTDTIPAGLYERCGSVTYKTNDGGSDIREYIKPYGEIPNKEITREGYELIGWYKDSKLTIPCDFSTATVTGGYGMILYAKWEAIEYTVTFNSNGGSSVANQAIAYNGVVTEPTNVTKQGYTLEGWYTDDATFQNKWSFDTVVTEDITLYAKWEVNPFTGNYVGSETFFTLYPNSTDTYYYLDDDGVLWFYGDNSTIPSSYSGTSSNILNTEHGVVLTNIKEVKFTDDCGTINVNDMSYMFCNLDKCESIELDKFNTSNCTNMQYLFYRCLSLTSLDLSDFDTSNVTDMSSMFRSCNKVTDLDVSGFNTSNVTDMSSMFYECNSLLILDLSNFDTSNVTTMGSMFFNCKNLTTLNVSGFNTSNVTIMGGMFQACNSLEVIDVSNFDTSNVISMASMFKGVKSIEVLNLSNFVTDKVTTMDSMFAYNTNLIEINLSSFNTSNVTSMDDMFTDCKALTTLNLSNFNTSNATSVLNMFNNCTGLKSLNISSFDLGKVTTVKNLFKTCTSLEEVKLPNINVTTRTDFVPSNTMWCYNQDYTTNVYDTLVGTDTIPAGTYERCYSVIYKTNDGGSDIVEYAKVNSLLPKKELTREGYTFIGWYKNSGLTTAWNHETDTVTANTTLYAKWVKEVYTVSFESNEGSLVASQDITYNEKVIEPSNPTKAHYVFKGWYTDNTYNTEWVFDTDLVTEPMTLYAKWEKEVYTVTFESNEGSAIANQNIAYQDKVTEPTAPTKAKAEFVGWYSDNTLTTPYDFDTKVEAPMTLYAKWVNTYEVTFNVDGGSAVETQTVRENEKATEPTAPTKVTFYFAGWYTDNTFATEYDFDTAVTSDFTLYAKWEGKLEHQKDVEQEASIEFTWDDTVDEVKDAIKDDEDAAYDKTNNYWTAKMNVAPADVATLESTYNELQTAAETYEYAMAFDITINKYISSDAEMQNIIDMKNVTETKKPLEISFNAPELPTKKAIDEYSFFRVHDGALEEIPVVYDRDKNVFTFESDKFSEFAFYYEIADVFTVTFESNDGSAVESQDVIDGHKATEPTAPTREGFEFMGWYIDTALTEGYDFESGVTADITLFAKWKKDVPTVQPTPEPTPTPGTEEPKKEDEESEDEEPTSTPDSEPIPEPIPPIIPVIPTEPVSENEEDEDNDTYYVSTIPIKEEIEVVNTKVYTYVRTTEYGNLVCNRELKVFDINLF